MEMAAMRKWRADIVSDIPVPGAELDDGKTPTPEDSGPLSSAMADAFAEVEMLDLLVEKCFIRLDGPVITVTAHPDAEHQYDSRGHPIVGHVEGRICPECDVIFFGKHPRNGCVIVVVQEVMEG